MKKILSTLAVVSFLITTPAIADDRYRDRNGYTRSQKQYVKERRTEQRRYTREHHRYDRHDRFDKRYHRNRDGVVIGILTGVVFGAILADGSRYNRYYYSNDVRPERNCYEIRHIDRYGRIISTYDCR